MTKVGFVGLEEASIDSGDELLNEILATDYGGDSYTEEEIIEELEGREVVDPWVINSRLSALTIPTSNRANPAPLNLPSPSTNEEQECDLAQYAELAVARMVADQKASLAQKREDPKPLKVGKSNKKSPVPVSPLNEPPRIFDIEEPPRITPVPVFDDPELGRKPEFQRRSSEDRGRKPKSKRKPSKRRSDDEYYSDPPETLIIRSFKARSTPFAANDDLSDISPILLSGDDEVTTAASTAPQEVLMAIEKASDSEQGSESALIQVNVRSDDPDAESEQASTTKEQPDHKKSNNLFRILAVVGLLAFVCVATGYLIVYMISLFKGGDETQTMPLNRQNETNASESDIDFVGARPTTPMDPFEPGCTFENFTQPNVIGQCICNSEIAIVANDVREKYYSLNMHLISMNISGVWDLLDSEESCDPRNQAMVWLATTYTKDKDDLVQKYLLASFFIQMTGEHWGNQEGWLIEEDICKWSGVTCNDNGMVSSVSLDGNGLFGSIPSELSLLTSIETLSLRNNAISGEIPSTLFSMPYINDLSLSFNQLVGTLPRELALASNLETLRVDMNSLTGTLDPFLGQLTSLKRLNFGYNQFVGTLPLDLFQLTQLEELILESNMRITGRLPSEMSNLQNMKQFSISGTNMLSRIPTQLGALTNLVEFKVANTQMSGIIPTEIALLTKLNHLNLSGGKFRRNIPTVLGQLPSLAYLSLSNNQLTGTIPRELGNLQELVHLSLHGNLLFGDIPKHLGYLTMLDTLTLEENNLTGRAPQEICRLRREELIVFTTDCSDGSEGVLCPVPNCCTSCSAPKTS